VGERTRTLLVAITVALIFQGLRHVIGVTPTLIIAACAMCFCIGAFWGAGAIKKDRAND